MSALRPSACACAEKVDSSGVKPDTCAIVVAGGSGLRFGDPRDKQYVELCGLPLACWSIIALDRVAAVGRIVVVCSPEREEEMRESVLGRISLRCEVTIAHAGATRQDSVRSGLAVVPKEFDYVAIHDAARPLILPEVAQLAIDRVRSDDTIAGAICAARVTDTLKLVEDSTIVATPERGFYWAAQTPQAFRRIEIAQAHAVAHRDGYVGTDDASLIERTGGRVVCVASPRDNIKVTLPEDLVIAAALMERRLIEEGCGSDFADGAAGSGAPGGPGTPTDVPSGRDGLL
jgi:2-C-methyl-D-erythritol 4-phosphate cytidylyltransferase